MLNCATENRQPGKDHPPHILPRGKRGSPCGTAINPLFEGTAFDPETLQAMGRAFELAFEQVRDTGQPDLVKEVLAKRIIELATRGEIDPVELCKGALMALKR